MTGTGLDNIRACLLLEQHALCISEQMDQLLGALRDQLRGALREDSTFSLTARDICCRALMPLPVLLHLFPPVFLERLASEC